MSDHNPSVAPSTEDFDASFAGIDHLPVADSLRMQLHAQRDALNAVERAIPDIDRAVAAAQMALKNHPRAD